MVLHRLQIVHPRKTDFHIQCQDVSFSRLVVEVQPDVMNGGLLRGIDELFQVAASLQNMAVQLTLYMVFFQFAVIVHA